MQLTYTAHAWVNQQFSSIERVLKGESQPCLSTCAPGDGGYFESEGHAYIGVANVTIEVNSRDQIVADQIKSLGIKLQKVRAESQQQENAILLQISKLQALTMNEVTA